MFDKCRNCPDLDEKDVFGHLYHNCRGINCPTGMTDYQEADLADLKTAAADALDSKYRAGQKEHGGNGWEMGATKLIAASYDEAIDLAVYLPWLRENIACIRELLLEARGALIVVNEIEAMKRIEQALGLIDGVPGRK